VTRRSARTPAPPAATWRDGAHLTGTPIWCDARRRRDVCFVSSADRVGRAGHGQLIATPATLALLATPARAGHLGVPVRQRFALGSLRLELLPSGHGVGAAGLLVEHAGQRVLYFGAVRSQTPSDIDAAEVRACDALVIAAPPGSNDRASPSLPATIEAAIAWAHEQLVARRAPTFLVDRVLDGLEVGAALRRAGITVASARLIREAEARLLAIHDRRTEGQPAEARTRAGTRTELAARVWLASDRTGLARSLGGMAHALARASGGPSDDSRQLVFPWTTVDARAALLAFIEATRARDVYVTGACAVEIARVLGARARVLAPPHQMQLALGVAP
jgi:putative mRNA 3-end processing factor